MKLPKTACAYPFKAAMLMHGQPATPCCRFHNRFLDNDKREIGQQLDPADFIRLMRQDFIGDIKDFDSTFAEVRETMMRDEWHPGCYKCKADEETKGHSMRTEANAFFDDFTDSVKLEYLEITVGRHCNLRCLSCGPEYSTKWDKDAIKFPELGNSAYDIEQLKKIEELDLDSVKPEWFKDLKFIKVTGGEPFLHPQFLRWVVALADSGIAPQVEIEIFTNCTYWPKKADYDALMQFKKIIICPSIDCIGEVNDVLRFPSKWDKVEKAIDQWVATREEFGWDKIEIKVAATISVLNAPYMLDFFIWTQYKRLDVQFQTVYEPHYMSILHWPDWFKAKLRYTVDVQFANLEQEPMKSVISKGYKIRWNRLRQLHRLLQNLCEANNAEDKSKQYTDLMKKILRQRDILDLDKLKRFKDLLELEAKAIPEWGSGERNEWQGRFKE